MQLLVGHDRADDLRRMALQGDDRAAVTLLEYLHRRGDREGLRREAEHLPRATLYLAKLSSRLAAGLYTCRQTTNRRGQGPPLILPTSIPSERIVVHAFVPPAWADAE